MTKGALAKFLPIELADTSSSMSSMPALLLERPQSTPYGSKSVIPFIEQPAPPDRYPT